MPATLLRVAWINDQRVLVALQGWASMELSSAGQPMELAVGGGS